MSEFLKEFFEDFKDRARNRFVTSFLIVWLYKHWLLIYWIITCDNDISVDERVSYIKKYLTDEGWENLTLYPLLIAFLALPLYLILASVSQWIFVWTGKRLKAALINKADKGKYTLTTLYNREKEKVNSLRTKVEELENEIQEIEEEKLQLKLRNQNLTEHQSEASKKLKECKDRFDDNRKFKDVMTIPLIYLLGKYQNIEVNGIDDRNAIRNEPKIISGNWIINDYQSVKDTRTSQVIELFIDGFQVSKPDETRYGLIEGITYDRTTSILSFSIALNSQREKLILIRVHENLFIGLRNNSYVEFRRNPF